jgi:hypothetical protein
MNREEIEISKAQERKTFEVASQALSGVFSNENLKCYVNMHYLGQVAYRAAEGIVSESKDRMDYLRQKELELFQEELRKNPPSNLREAVQNARTPKDPM